MPSTEDATPAKRRYERDASLPRSLRSGARLVAVLGTIVAVELFAGAEILRASFGARAAEAGDAAAAIERAISSPNNDDDALYRLHRALSRGAIVADVALVERLLGAPDPRVREFAASPTIAKFGHLDSIEGRIALQRRRPREIFRQRLWHRYQLGVVQPPRFLTVERIRDHLASLDGDPHEG